MLSAVTGALALSSGFLAGSPPSTSVVRSNGATMMSKYNGCVWGLPEKTDIFMMWNPGMPRTYENFNPFERNDEGQMCDTNGCFPGTDRGYTIPERPDVSWAIQQANDAKMDQLKMDPKFSLSGQPGNWSPKWQTAALGPPPN